MAKRQALAIEGDAAFVTVLRETLEPYDIELLAVEDGRQALLRLKAVRPAVLFLSVELPDRKGFALCTRARRSARGVPIVLATGSLPWNEMTMHEITRAHADAYLDKRGLTGAKVLQLLERLVELGPPRNAAGSGSRVLKEGPAPVAAAEPEPVINEPAQAEQELPQDAAALRAEVEQLRREAQGARRGRTSSGETMLLRDELHERERESAQYARKAFELEHSLAEALERQTELIHALESERTERERLEQALAWESERLGETAARLAESANAHTLLEREAQEAIELAREVHQDELRGFEQRLSEIEAARSRAEKAESSLQQDCTRLARNLAALEEERQRRDREIREALLRAREEQRAALFAAKLEHESALSARDKAHAAALAQTVAAEREAARQALQAEIARLEAQHALEVETEADRHQKALAALRRIHSEMLAEQEARWGGAQERIDALEGSQVDAQAALTQRAQELDALRERLAEQARALAERQREIAHTEAVIARHEGMIGDGARQSEALAGEVRQLEQQLEAAQAERLALEARRNELERKVAEGSGERSSLREQVAVLQAEAAKKQEDLQAAALRSEELTAELAQAQRHIGEREGALKQQQEHMAIIEAARAAAVEQRDTLERQMAEARSAARAHEEDALAAARAEQERTTSALRHEIDEERATLAERERQALDGQIREREAAVAEAVTKVELRWQDEAHAREADLRRELASVAEAESRAQATLAETRAALERARSEISQLEEGLTARDRILPTLEAELTDQRETITSLQAVVSDFSNAAVDPAERPKLPPE